MSFLYILAGFNHFRSPSFYLKITPKWVPAPKAINAAVGVIEIALGLGLLFTPTQSIAAVGIILLLIAVFPANVRHYLLAKRKGQAVLVTLIRLPLQVALIFWATTFV